MASIESLFTGFLMGRVDYLCMLIGPSIIVFGNSFCTHQFYWVNLLLCRFVCKWILQLGLANYYVSNNAIYFRCVWFRIRGRKLSYGIVNVGIKWSLCIFSDYNHEPDWVETFMHPNFRVHKNNKSNVLVAMIN